MLRLLLFMFFIPNAYADKKNYLGFGIGGASADIGLSDFSGSENGLVNFGYYGGRKINDKFSVELSWNAAVDFPVIDVLQDIFEDVELESITSVSAFAVYRTSKTAFFKTKLGLSQVRTEFDVSDSSQFTRDRILTTDFGLAAGVGVGVEAKYFMVELDFVKDPVLTYCNLVFAIKF